MARYRVKIALIIIILSCSLLTAGCVTNDQAPSPTSSTTPTPTGDFPSAIRIIPMKSSSNITVTGRVMNEIGQPAADANVTLWLDGKIVDIPDNPQLTETGWNGDEFQPYDSGSFEFHVQSNKGYLITCEKDGYYGEAPWDPGNPIPALIVISNPGMNASDTKLKYDNVSDSQVEDAKAFAFNNQSIRQMLDGINYSIEYVTTASDEMDPLVMEISILIGNYGSDGVEITSHLLICVDLTNKKIVTIQHPYDGGRTIYGCIWEIAPGGNMYSRIVLDGVNGSHQGHMLTLGFTCQGDLVVKPMVLDATNFKKFTDGEPYDIYLFGNETVSSDWSKSLIIPSNREYYFVVTNERADKVAKIDSKIDLTV